MKTSLLCFSILILAGSGASAKGSSNLSKSVTPKVVDALATELERAKTRLVIPGAPSPYFISYKVTEVDVSDVSASLGSTLDEKQRHFVGLEAHVHVGGYDKDNSNFIAPGKEHIDGIATTSLPLEASANRARRAAWLVTDAAYKEALEQYQSKSDAMATGVGQREVAASYSSAAPLVQGKEVGVTPLEDQSVLENKAKKLSALFAKQDHIRDSRVSYTSFIERRWYLNSEGTSATDTRRVSGVVVVASSLASDGEELKLYYSKYGHEINDLPAFGVLSKKVDEMSGQLKTMQSSPRGEAYTGPVLFEGMGAVQLISNTLSPHLSGTPPPVGTSGKEALHFAGKLSGRKGLKVMSSLLTLEDDPTIRTFGKTPLIGGYLFDDEGVRSDKVRVVQKGRLENLLMSRTPNGSQLLSNGHARLSMRGGVFRGSTTNLFVNSSKGLSKSKLRKKLLSEAKAQGLDYGVVVKLMDDPFITASRELTRVELVQILNTVNRTAPPPMLLVYKLYKNGKEELMRGMGLDTIELRAWKDLVATGKNRFTANFLSSTEDPLLQRLAGVGPGFVPSGGVESSITTPDLLFKELDMVPVQMGRLPQPKISRP